MKKQLAAILVLIMVLALVPAVTLADGAAGGFCGVEFNYNTVLTSSNANITSGKLEIGSEPASGGRLQITMTDLVVAFVGNEDVISVYGSEDVAINIVGSGNRINFNSDCAIKAKGDLHIIGTGTLNILSISGTGIDAFKDLYLELTGGGTLKIKAVHGIKCKINMHVNSGINIVEGVNNLVFDNTLSESNFKSQLNFNGGDTTLSATNAAIGYISYELAVNLVEVTSDPAQFDVSQIKSSSLNEPRNTETLYAKEIDTGNRLMHLHVYASPSPAIQVGGEITYTYEDWVRDNQYDQMAPSSGLEPDAPAPAEDIYGPMTTPVPEAAAPVAPVTGQTPPQTGERVSPVGFVLAAIALAAACVVWVRRKAR